MNDFDDDIRAALHADAARAPETPPEWRPSGRQVYVSAGQRRRTLLLASSAVIAVGLVAIGVVLTRSDRSDRITTPIDSTSPTSAVAVTLTTSRPAVNTFPVPGIAVENFLIVGADANACVDPGSPWAGAADPARAGTRSDTIMIMRVDPVAHRAAVLSFPRDLWVAVPGHGKQRINSTYVPNDYSLLAQTIADNFGITVDHYLQIDFCAFKRIIDAVGGVAVPFPAAVRDRNVGLDIAAGCHVFSGDEALAYVRSRHFQVQTEDGTWREDPTADFGRIARQQDFLRRVLTTALEKGLFDPAVAGALIDSLQRDIVTELGFTIEDLMRLVGTLREIDPSTIQQYRIDATGITVSGNAVLQPITDTPAMTAVLAIFRGDTAVDSAPAAGPRQNSTATNDSEPFVPDPAQDC
jgi:LCP family protein required for cell wall assembly